MAVISINYNEGNKVDLDYKSVQISFNHKDIKVFETGNFVKDWYNMRKFIIQELSDSEYIFYSSSIDHFIMDGAPYESIYLKYDINKKIHYLTKEFDFKDKGIEFFVPKGKQFSWNELKEYCTND